jgi:hypothetical protein
VEEGNLMLVVLVLLGVAVLLAPTLAGVMVFTAYVVGAVGRYGDRKAAQRVPVASAEALGDAAAKEVFAAMAEGRPVSVSSMKQYINYTYQR